MTKLKVGIIMGGISSEREISLQTGREMLAHLDTDKYEEFPIIINSKQELFIKAAGIDIALLALHGKFGEDGTIQGALDTMGVAYSGCGVLASSVCMDKDMSKKLMRYEGVCTADWMVVRSLTQLKELKESVNRLGYPVVVKPNSGGSSIGTVVVHSEQSLEAAVQEALRWDDSVMLEQFVAGEEITCAILNGELLPIVSIQSNAEFFDYTSKYEDGGADEQVIELPQDVYERVASAALACYAALRSSVYARIDMIIRDGIPYVLEINTLPGLTKNSLLPKSAAAAGISFSGLLDAIIQYSLIERNKQ